MMWQRVMTTATRGYQALAAAEQARAAGTDDPGVWVRGTGAGPRPSLYPAIPKEPRERPSVDKLGQVNGVGRRRVTLMDR
jgi:hypothetical protein